MELNFTSNVEAWTAELQDVYKRQIPFAIAKSLNETVDDLKRYHESLLPAIFDQPTRYTINGLRAMKASSRGELRASVGFLQPRSGRAHHLSAQVEGGPRDLKRFERLFVDRGYMHSNERAVPASGVKLNSHGNIPLPVIKAILAGLAPRADDPAKQKSGRKSSLRHSYFIPHLGSSLARGIWRRKGARAVQPVIFFVTRSTYQRRYEFHQLSKERSEQFFPAAFERAMAAGIEDQNRFIASRMSRPSR